MKIETLEIAGLGPALEALRLPHDGKRKSKISSYHMTMSNKRTIGRTEIQFSPEDERLLKNLRTSGDDHAKVLRGVIVWVEITAPRYWWQEADTYNVGIVKLGSTSTMHGKFKNLFGEELQKAKAELKEGTENKRVWAISYQSLTRIYNRRKQHKLGEWQVFCTWVESLPYFEELIKPIDYKQIITDQVVERAKRQFCINCKYYFDCEKKGNFDNCDSLEGFAKEVRGGGDD